MMTKLKTQNANCEKIKNSKYDKTQQLSCGQLKSEFVKNQNLKKTQTQLVKKMKLKV